MRIIPPEAFDQPQPPADRRRRSVWAVLAGGALIVLFGAMVLWPGESEPDPGADDSMSLARGDPPGDDPASPPAPPSDRDGRLAAEDESGSPTDPDRTGANPSGSYVADSGRADADRAPSRSADPDGAGSDRTDPVEVAIGWVYLFGDLPSGVWIEIGGDVLPRELGVGAPIRVAADTVHSVAVHAEGYEPWTSEVYVPADSTVRLHPELRRIVPASPAMNARRAQSGAGVGGDDAGRPAGLPAEVRDSLIHRLAQGRFLLDIGRYVEAAEELEWVVDSAVELGERYAPQGELLALRARADSALEAARTECRRDAGATTCP